MLVLPRPPNVELFMQRDIMVARYHKLEFRRSLLEHVEHRLEFGEVADFCDVAGVEEYVGFGEGEAVCMGRVGGWKWGGGMGIGDDEEAGTDSFGGHGGGFEGLSREGGVEGGTVGR